MSHTEGPWYVGDDTGEDCPNHCGGGLALVDTGRFSDFTICRHVEWNNAPLIAAATDLLALVREFLSCDPEHIPEVESRARALLAQIEGE
jgi:hypothetical protein